MGQFSVEKPVLPGSVLSGNQHDALYGGDSQLRRMLEARRQPYVLAVRSNQTLRMIAEEGFIQADPKGIAEILPRRTWKTPAAGEGSKDLRLYDWARYPLPWTADEGSSAGS